MINLFPVLEMDKNCHADGVNVNEQPIFVIFIT